MAANNMAAIHISTGSPETMLIHLPYAEHRIQRPCSYIFLMLSAVPRDMLIHLPYVEQRTQKPYSYICVMLSPEPRDHTHMSIIC